MKKYLWLLAPLGACFAVAFFNWMAALRSDVPDLDLDHVWLAFCWIVVGLVMTVLAGMCLAIHDLFEWINQRQERKLLERRD